MQLFVMFPLTCIQSACVLSPFITKGLDSIDALFEFVFAYLIAFNITILIVTLKDPGMDEKYWDKVMPKTFSKKFKYVFFSIMLVIICTVFPYPLLKEHSAPVSFAIWFILSPIAFILQFIGIVFAIMQFMSRRIYSKYGTVPFEESFLQKITYFLFNFMYINIDNTWDDDYDETKEAQ